MEFYLILWIYFTPVLPWEMGFIGYYLGSGGDTGSVAATPDIVFVIDFFCIYFFRGW